MKMLVSDYDNTFYITEDGIKKNVESVNEFMKENLFVIATGRAYLSFNEVEELYNINYHYLIINHGSTILKNDEVIFNYPIDNNIKDQIINDLYLNEIVFYFACSLKNSRLFLHNPDLTKIHVKYKNKDRAKIIKDFIQDKYKDYINTFLVDDNRAIEIVAKEVDKANAIKKIAELEKIDIKDIYTIGDNYNDIDMIKKYNGCAVKGAVLDVQNVAKKKCASVADLIAEIKE